MQYPLFSSTDNLEMLICKTAVASQIHLINIQQTVKPNAHYVTTVNYTLTSSTLKRCTHGESHN